MLVGRHPRAAAHMGHSRPKMVLVSETARDLLVEYINSTTAEDSVVATARLDSSELGLVTPDAMTASFLTTLVATSNPNGSAIVISPAAGLISLAVIRGLGAEGTLTCIDTEPEHQAVAKKALTAAGFPTSRVRFLPARPLEVMTRLAPDTYSFIYAEPNPQRALATIERALPLLTDGGVLLLADVLVDGIALDESRTDAETQAIRALDQALAERDDLTVSRLPLGAGMTVIVKKAAD